MTTTANLLTKLRTDWLLNGNTHRRNKLATGVGLSDLQIALTYDVDALARGGHISVGLEDIEVWTADTGTRLLDVERGQRGTTVRTHPSSSMVLINPRYSDARLLRAINDDISSLSAEGLFAMRTSQFAYRSATTGYAMPADLVQVYQARWEDRHGNDWHDIMGVETHHSADTGDYPSGISLHLRGDHPAEGADIEVAYRARYTGTLSSLTETVETIVPAEYHDIVMMGAAIRLEAGAEIRRNAADFQSGSRRAEEVPPGAQAQSIRNLQILRKQRLDAEREAFSRRYPTLMSRR